VQYLLQQMMKKERKLSLTLSKLFLAAKTSLNQCDAQEFAARIIKLGRAVLPA